jgi:S1-C subfamily serine protease
MKKKLAFSLIVFFLLGLIPTNFSQAITQNQISSEVQIVCTDGADNWFSGSGTIIDPKGIILTNRHVVEGAYGNICYIGFLESINQEPNFGSEQNPNLAEVKYITTDNSMDAAVLYLNNTNNLTLPYVNIWNSNSSNLKFGDKIEVIGYPGIGGSTITYTSGDFSGFGGQSDGTQNYIKTTAVLEHGNSGGSAYNQRGEFVGIPSMVVSGSLNSISYILSVDSIKKWLSGFLGSNYKQDIIEEKPIITEQPKVSLQNDITPPSMDYGSLGIYEMDSNGTLKNFSYAEHTVIYEFPKLSFGWSQNCGDNTNTGLSCVTDNSGEIEGYYYYFGQNPNAIPKNDGEYIAASDLSKDVHFKNDNNWKSIIANEIKLPVIFDAKKGKNYFILQAKDKSGNISNQLVNFEYIYESDNFKDIENIDVKNYNNKLIGNLDYPNNQEMPVCVNNSMCKGKVELGYVAKTIETNQSTLYLYPNYGYDIDGLVYYISYGEDTNWGTNARVGISTNQKYIKIPNIAQKGVVNVFIKPFAGAQNSFFGKHHVLTIRYVKNLKTEIIPKNENLYSGKWEAGLDSWVLLKFNKIDEGLLNKSKGKIFLQIENHGEAWYVNPVDNKRYYMADGEKAYNAMRRFGVGINNENLKKIKNDKNYAKKFSGKIFLQVESKGEAYYIDFNGNANYLKDGTAAYGIMRSLGVGITNNDLNKISEGSL